VKPAPPEGTIEVYPDTTAPGTFRVRGDEAGELRCPFGRPGNSLWVRETFASGVPGCEPQGGFSYRADHQDPRGDGPAHPMRWTPSIHMPRAASRITLVVTYVRCERLHAITEQEAIAEGVQRSAGGLWCGGAHRVTGAQYPTQHNTAREAFADLWSSINGAESWAANPWVWRVGFRRPSPEERVS
jgi:hypothetical protein